MSERCQRCGIVGEDRRTLWHACFSAMEELGIPFTQRIVFHLERAEDYEKIAILKEAVKLKLKDGFEITLGAPTVKCDAELTPMAMYCLRVCKPCRASWLETLKKWFDGPTVGPTVGD